MGRVAREMVEQAGLDVNVLLDKLVAAAGAEFTTFYYYYTILRVNAIGIDCPYHHYAYDARTGENRYPKRVFPRERADKVRSIRAFEARDDDGWVWVRAGNST